MIICEYTTVVDMYRRDALTLPFPCSFYFQMHMPMLSMTSLIPFLLLLTLLPPIHTSNTPHHPLPHNTHRNRRLKIPLSLPKNPFPHVTGLFHPIADSLDKLRKSKLKVTRTKKKTNFTEQLHNYIKSIAGHVNDKGFPPKQKYKGHNKTLTTIR